MAAVYLKSRFYQILEKNFRCKCGEIDIIAKKGEYYVFIEVKYRTTAESGLPAEAVTKPKQQHIKKTAAYYLMQNDLYDKVSCRFDVIDILGTKLTHYKNAF